MRLSTGEIVYTNPYAADSDNDGLLDGEEICVAVDGLRLLQYPGLPLEYGKQVVFLKIADPWDRDSDDDGLLDGEDTAPLLKGLAGGIVGRMHFISGDGHSFLAYQSYVNDSINMYNFDQILYYSALSNAFVYDGVTTEYLMNPNDYITIGLSANTLSVNVLFGGYIDYYFSSLGSNPVVPGGIKCNWELSNMCFDENDNQQPNVSISIEITNSQLQSLIVMWNNSNYYNVFNHNCTVLVIDSWNIVCQNPLPFTYLPMQLKTWLAGFPNPTRFVLEPILEGMKEKIS